MKHQIFLEKWKKQLKTQIKIFKENNSTTKTFVKFDKYFLETRTTSALAQTK